jgi:hypothetical protein
MKLLISLYGLSETGKTLSALKLAAGIEPNPAKRMMLDTEGGQRGRAYVDLIAGGYLYGALTPPFTPERYIEALNEIEEHGVNVLVIDSVSHAWFAEGGVLDMVEAATEKNDMAKWAKPKRRLGKMTRRMLSSDMHIILCSRAKQPLIEEYVDGRKKLTLGPVVPVQEKTLRYDMTIMAQMLGDGRFTIAAPAGKCPGSLRPAFATELMNEAMGQKLASWVSGGEFKTAGDRHIEIEAREVAERGTDAFRAWWKAAAPGHRDHLKPMMANFQSIAKAADDDAEALRRGEGNDDDSDAGGAPFQMPTSVSTDPDGYPATAHNQG